MEAILRNFEQGIKDGIAKARNANTVEPIVGQILDATKHRPKPFVKYLVFVEGRGWTDGQFRTDGPTGWCHKWASDGSIFNREQRGVTHFCNMPPLPNVPVSRGTPSPQVACSACGETTRVIEPNGLCCCCHYDKNIKKPNAQISGGIPYAESDC